VAVGKRPYPKKIKEKLEAKNKNVLHINMDDYLNLDVEIIPHFPIIDNHRPWRYWDTDRGIIWESLFRDIWKARVENIDVIIIEGGHFMASEKLRDLCHKVFYLDAPEEVCRTQRLKRGKHKTEEVMKVWLEYWQNHLLPFAMENRAKAMEDKNISFVKHDDPELDQTTFQLLLPFIK